MKKTIMKSALLALLMRTIAPDANAQTDDFNQDQQNVIEENEGQKNQEEKGSIDSTNPERSSYDLNQIDAPSISIQAEELKKFGEYPIDFSTGVPNITIPLYEIEIGDFRLPIAIAYHASGLKYKMLQLQLDLGGVL